MAVFVSGDADNRRGDWQPDTTLAECRLSGVPCQCKVRISVLLFQFSEDRKYLTYGIQPINSVGLLYITT